MTHPSDILREALRGLAQRKLLPTPENYRTLYQEITGRSNSGDGTPDFRDLLVYTLDTAIAPLLADTPKLSGEARGLAAEIKAAEMPAQMDACQLRLKRFAYDLEIRNESQAGVRDGLLKLIRLLMEYLGEMASDDQWAQGQIRSIQEIVNKPLSLRVLEDAEKRLKEVAYKQSQQEDGLDEAKTALRDMLVRFVDQLAQVAATTPIYHEKIEACAQRISSATDVAAISEVLEEVMRETRAMGEGVRLSQSELHSSLERVEEAEERIGELEKDLEATSGLVRYDPLTGALNRRGMDETFQREIARATRQKTCLCVCLLDIDDFRKINGILGNEAGDKALSLLAELCRDTLRPQDGVARFGGEEFVLLLPDTGLQQGVSALGRVQKELTRNAFLYNNHKVLITFSAGVTMLQEGDTQASILRRLGVAMAQAKQQGKNRVVALE